MSPDMLMFWMFGSQFLVLIGEAVELSRGKTASQSKETGKPWMFPWFLTLYTSCSVLWKLVSHLSPPSLVWNLRETFRDRDQSQNKSFFKLILSDFVVTWMQSGWLRKTGTRTVEWSLCLDLAPLACRTVSWEEFWKVWKYKLEKL